MFKNIGTIELSILALVLVIIFGGKKIAELIRSLGESIRAYRRSAKGE